MFHKRDLYDNAPLPPHSAAAARGLPGGYLGERSIQGVV